MIEIREPESIHVERGEIENGTFEGRWHFSFGSYRDPAHERFGLLRVFNDDTLSAGAVWPLHRHRDIEVVTYCAGGEFRHADQDGPGGILRKGDVQHTTVGSGIFHSEINNLPDEPMRFVQMWFIPLSTGLVPSVEQKRVERYERTDRLLPIVAPKTEGALPIRSDAVVYSSYLTAGASVDLVLEDGRGAYVYVVEGGPVAAGVELIEPLGAAEVSGERRVDIFARADAELLVVEVAMVN